MKLVSLLAAFSIFSIAGLRADPAGPAADEQKYTATLEKRAADILKTLALADTNQAVRVRDIIISQYRALNAWHNQNDASLKAARGNSNSIADIKTSLKTLHDQFLSQLAQNLSPAQVDQVKDKLTYGKVQFTYAGYLAQYSNLSEADRQAILAMLKQAREEAMDGGSAAEKTAVFTRYKGKINNFLSKQGLHPAAQRIAPVITATNATPKGE